jgi:hypothetical protein
LTLHTDNVVWVNTATSSPLSSREMARTVSSRAPQVSQSRRATQAAAAHRPERSQTKASAAWLCPFESTFSRAATWLERVNNRNELRVYALPWYKHPAKSSCSARCVCDNFGPRVIASAAVLINIVRRKCQWLTCLCLLYAEKNSRLMAGRERFAGCRRGRLRVAKRTKRPVQTSEDFGGQIPDVDENIGGLLPS